MAVEQHSPFLARRRTVQWRVYMAQIATRLMGSIMRASLSGLTISHLCLSALPRATKESSYHCSDTASQRARHNRHCSPPVGLKGGARRRVHEGMAQQNKPPAPCSVLFWPVLEHPQNRRVLSVLPPPTFFREEGDGGAATGRSRRPPAWLPSGARTTTRGGPRKKSRKYQRC